MHSSISKSDEKNRFLAKPFKYVEAWFYIFFISHLDLSSLAQHRNVFTFGGAKRNRSDKECTKFSDWYKCTRAVMALMNSIFVRYIRFKTVAACSSQLPNIQPLKCRPMMISWVAFQRRASFWSTFFEERTVTSPGRGGRGGGDYIFQVSG